MAERSSALDSSSGVVRMWVRIPAWPVAALVSLSKTLNHNCFVLQMVRKTVRPGVVCNARKRTQDTYREREGGLPVFLDWVAICATAPGVSLLTYMALYKYQLLTLNMSIKNVVYLRLLDWLSETMTSPLRNPWRKLEPHIWKQLYFLSSRDCHEAQQYKAG